MLSADYVVGLVDGEGSFCVYSRKPSRVTWNTRIECHFYVKMREDDLKLLQKVQKFFRCGSIFFQREYRVNQRDNYRYQVSDKQKLKNVIIPFFKKHPLQSKRIRDFELFCEILERAMRKEHQTPDGLKRILNLKQLMHAWGLAVCGKSARTAGDSAYYQDRNPPVTSGEPVIPEVHLYGAPR